MVMGLTSLVYLLKSPFLLSFRMSLLSFLKASRLVTDQILVFHIELPRIPIVCVQGRYRILSEPITPKNLATMSSSLHGGDRSVKLLW